MRLKYIYNHIVLNVNVAAKSLLFIFLSILIISCKKYLDKKPLKTQVVPTTIADLQAVMDANIVMNINYLGLQELCADNYYLTSYDWTIQSPDERNLYLWNSSTVNANVSNWLAVYIKVYYSNFVLDQLPNISNEDINEYNNIKGQALFFRAYNFWGVAQLWCRPYSSTASSDLGIPLKLTAAVEDRSVRSTVQQTYDQIINDLKEAANLLPETVPALSRPNKAAAYGALARTYLSMRDYVTAGRYADSCLKRFSTLIDYATQLNPSSTAPIARFNAETVFYNTLSYLTTTKNTFAKIDSTLYQSYDTNDKRKVIFFKSNGNNTYGFKGSYDGTTQPDALFNGIATDEMYLIRAECSARAVNKDSAMADLNRLMIKRWASGLFVPFTATDATDALNKILIERRKELIYRGLRWSDLRRLNLENANIALKRSINGTIYILVPSDLQWILLIPYDVISLSGMQQNPR